MKKHKHTIITCIILVILAGWGIRAYLHKYRPPNMGFSANELVTVDEGKKITINDYRGKVIIVSCFQTWCGACIGETPGLNQLATRLNTDKLAVIYITDEGLDEVKPFRNRVESEKILFSFSPESLSSLGIHVYPTTFLINKKGEVVKTKLEGYDWLQEEAAIRKMLDE